VKGAEVAVVMTGVATGGCVEPATRDAFFNFHVS
jgi:hypothetical protein